MALKVDMKPLDDKDGRYWLTQGVARTVGVNITEEIAKGTLTRAEFAEMVARCHACQHAESCVRWMAEGGQGEGPPSYCLNHELMEALLAR